MIILTDRSSEIIMTDPSSVIILTDRSSMINMTDRSSVIIMTDRSSVVIVTDRSMIILTDWSSVIGRGNIKLDTNHHILPSLSRGRWELNPQLDMTNLLFLRHLLMLEHYNKIIIPSLTLPLFIEVPVPSQESEQSYRCQGFKYFSSVPVLHYSQI